MMPTAAAVKEALLRMELDDIEPLARVYAHLYLAECLLAGMRIAAAGTPRSETVERDIAKIRATVAALVRSTTQAMASD
jgi:hypothetical protein